LLRDFTAVLGKLGHAHVKGYPPLKRLRGPHARTRFLRKKGYSFSFKALRNFLKNNEKRLILAITPVKSINEMARAIVLTSCEETVKYSQ
jgi:hypothetical protein